MHRHTERRPPPTMWARRPARVPRAALGWLFALILGLLAVAAPAAQASQRPATSGHAARPAVATTYPYTFSRIAWTGSDEVIAATDKHGDLYSFTQAKGSSTWTKQLVAKGSSTVAYSKPSITWTGTTLYIAAVTGTGDLFFFTKTPPATTWSSTLLATAGSSKFQAPSVTAGDGYVLISVGNTAGDLETFTLAPGGTTWTEQTLAFGTFGPSSIATCFDSLNSSYLGLVTASSGGTQYFWWEELAEPGWIQETVAAAGSGGSYTGGSITASANYLEITTATTSGAVEFFSQAIGGSGWAQLPVSTTGSYTNPQIAWTGSLGQDSYDLITAASSTGDVDFWWNYDASSTHAWTPETIAAHGTSAVYKNPGIAITSTSAVVTAINTKPGNVMYWYQPFGTSPWTGQTVAKG